MVRIVADSTCDLSDELIEKYNIGNAPLCIVLGDKTYYDKQDITQQEIFDWCEANKTTPKTTACTPEVLEKAFRDAAKAGDETVFIGISEDMSTTCNVARLVGEEMNYDGLYVINSMNLSSGIGHLVIKAAILANQGKSAAEITDIINEQRSKVRASFVVDKLTYLARGGRCSSVTALLANTLKLKPRIAVTDGKMDVSKKYRGNLSNVLLKYVKEMEPELLAADPDRVFITHSGCNREVVNEVREYLEKLNYFKEIHETIAGGVISSHCGPDTLGVLYMTR